MQGIVSRKEHWERIYSGNLPERLGWYEPRLQTSLMWIRDLDLDKDENIIDVGEGASTLVDDLLREGYRNLTVFDLAGNALSMVKKRLGESAQEVTWIEGDITSSPLSPEHYALWHDRAVFHFLTRPEDRDQYSGNMRRALKHGGCVIIGTFAPEAPPTCSGLAVERYTPARLSDTLGPELALQEHRKELHITPGGVEQMYLYCRFLRSS
jgi:SAM-dependent methyltransferase